MTLDRKPLTWREWIHIPCLSCLFMGFFLGQLVIVIVMWLTLLLSAK
jgi:hypothetical protein